MSSEPVSSESAPSKPESLSPFESRSTTLAVLWSTLLIATMVLMVTLIFWV